MDIRLICSLWFWDLRDRARELIGLRRSLSGLRGYEGCSKGDINRVWVVGHLGQLKESGQTLRSLKSKEICLTKINIPLEKKYLNQPLFHFLIKQYIIH